MTLCLLIALEVQLPIPFKKYLNTEIRKKCHVLCVWSDLRSTTLSCKTSLQQAYAMTKLRAHDIFTYKIKYAKACTGILELKLQHTVNRYFSCPWLHFSCPGLNPFNTSRETTSCESVNNNFIRHFDARKLHSRPLLSRYLSQTTCTSFSIDFGCDFRSVLKHDLKSYDIVFDVHNSRKRVGKFELHETIHRPVVSLSHRMRQIRTL